MLELFGINLTLHQGHDLAHFRRLSHDSSYIKNQAGDIIGVNIRNQGDQLKSVRISDTDNLKDLQYLNLSDNEQLAELVFEVNLPSLSHLDVSDSNLKMLTISKAIPRLITLDVSRNQLKKLSFKVELPSLKTLDLGRNRIKNWDIDCLDYFPALEYLYLYGNPLNESVTAYHLEEDGANNLPSLKELKAAFDKGERVKNDEYKVLVVGDGKAGKTCFVKRLIDDEFCGNTWDSTHGISVRQFTNKKGIYQFENKLNIWDFGGQDLYHNTHGLFMQTNTTYVLVWSSETENKDFVTREEKGKKREWKNRKLKYWLKYIAHLGGKSPVLVAQSSSPVNYPREKHPEQRVFENLYEDYFPALSFLDIDAEIDNNPKESGYKKLMSRMDEAIDVLEREEWLPKHWVAIRDELEKMKPDGKAKTKAELLETDNNVMEYDAFIHLAKSMGEDSPERLLENWLVKTGTVFYKKGLFGNQIILNQEWAIKAIYTLFDRSERGFYHDIKDNHGLFDDTLLNQCWKNNSEPEKELFLSFMLSCDMCFEIKERGEINEMETTSNRQFIAVEMLSDQRPSNFAQEEGTWKKYKEELLYLKYKHSFLFHGIIKSFIARTFQFSEVTNIYQNGALIEVQDISAIVEAFENEIEMNGEVLVKIPKKGIKVLFQIQKEFEDIHISEVEQEVSLDGKVFVNIEKLKEEQDEDQIVAEDGSIVKRDAYKIFLQKEEKTESLSEKLARVQHEKNRAGRRGGKKYLKETSNVIDIEANKNVHTFIPFEEIEGKATILFLTATPISTGQLNTGKESRFKDLVRYFDDEKKFKVIEEHGISSEDFQNFVINKKPHIVHYGGHGETEGIILEDGDLDGDSLADILELSDNVQCVILNACYSLPIAKKVAQFIPYVIGTQDTIADESAIAFARGFYTAIVSGMSVEKAFKSGVISIKRKKLPDADIPILVKGIHP